MPVEIIGMIADGAAVHTERLSYLIAHRPGFVAPTLTPRAVRAG